MVRRKSENRRRRSTGKNAYNFSSDDDGGEDLVGEDTTVTAARHKKVKEKISANTPEDAVHRRKRRKSVPSNSSSSRNRDDRRLDNLQRQDPQAHVLRADDVATESAPLQEHGGTNVAPQVPNPIPIANGVVEDTVADQTTSDAEQYNKDEAERDTTADNSEVSIANLRARDEELNFPEVIPSNDVPGVLQGRGTTHSVSRAKFMDRISTVLSYESLVAALVVNGPSMFSKNQYGDVHQVIAGITKMSCGESVLLPFYDTVMYTMRNKVLNWCFPKSDIFFVAEASRPRGARRVNKVQTKNAGSKAAIDSVRLILPSEWAKLDVCTYTTYTDIFEHPNRDSPEHLSIESTPIVNSRATFVGEKLGVWCSFEGAPCVAKQGDVLDIPCAGAPIQVDKRRTISQSWIRAESEEKSVPGDATDKHIRAVLCGVWQVEAAPGVGVRRAAPPLPPKGYSTWTVHERSLMKKFSVSSPNQDALDTALENMNEEVDVSKTRRVQTLMSCSENVIQLYPGDHCILFRAEPVHSELQRGKQSYQEPNITQHCFLIGSLVSQAKGHPAERLVWLNVEEGTENNGRASVRYVGTCNVTNMPLWVRGAHGTPHTGYEFGRPKNIGFLEDGSRYLVYRFALYMDGFKQLPSNQDTRSVCGFYLLPLGLSLETKRNKAAPRVVSLSSCTTSEKNLWKLIMDDLCRAASEGVDGVDPYGRTVGHQISYSTHTYQ